MKTYQKIIVGLGVLLTSALLIWFIIDNQKPSYFNKVELTSTTHIFNLTKQSYLDTIIGVALEELEVYPNVVVIKDMSFAPPNIKIPGKELSAFVYGEGGTYIIYIKNMSRVQSLEVMSHELIHLRDMEKGELLTGKNLVIYRGVRYVGNQIPEYDYRLWETVAVEDGKDLEYKIKDILYE
jgi:hypothetical protein